MKFWFTVFALMSFLPMAHAQSCSDAVSKVLDREINQAGWTSHGLEHLAVKDLDEVLENSNELDEDQIAEIHKYSSRSDYEWYLFTGTGDYSGGFQRLLMVNNKTCKIRREWTTYVE